MALAVSPRITGTIGVSPGSGLKPMAMRRSRKYLAFSCSRVTRSGWAPRNRTAASGLPATVGGGAVAVHGEDAVGEHDPPARPLRCLQLLLEVRHIGVSVHGGLALGDRLGEPDRIDDRRVVQLIGDDGVLLAQHSGAEPFVGV